MAGRGSGSVLPAWMTEAKTAAATETTTSNVINVVPNVPTSTSTSTISGQFKDSQYNDSPKKGRGSNGIPLLPEGI